MMRRHPCFAMIKKIVRWALSLFFASTILAVVAYRFIPVYVTPLMLIRCVQTGSLTIHHHWVPLEQMSRHMPVAVMAAEDSHFLLHHGFDFNAIGSAAKRNMANGKGGKRFGASTISQQTAKNVFLWPGRSWVRKGFEVYFTALIEVFWSKQRIMEVYLNSIEMGDGIYGADAVAEWHFSTTAKDLAKGQCALIAASLPNPRKYDSAHPSRYMLRRKAKIIREMNYLSNISSQQKSGN